MADQPSAQSWMKDWDALGKQFWGAWTQAAQQVAPNVPPHPGFDLWAKLYADNKTQQGDVVERVIGGTKQMAALMQSAIAQLAGKQHANPADFAASIQQALGGFSSEHNPVADALRAAVGQGSKGFEQLFGEFAKFATPMKNEMLSAFNLPAFGSGREQQEQRQHMAKAWIDFGEALSAYNGLMLKASQRGLEQMESKLEERSEPGRELSSLRAFYDLYIDAAEEGYAEVVMTDEFRKVYGDLVNAQMRVRQLVQQEVERSTAQLGMPTRTEMNSTHKRMADMRRRVARLEELLAAQGIETSDEVDSEDADQAPIESEAAAPPVSRAKAKAKAKAAPTPASKTKPTARTATAARTALSGVADFAARLAAARGKPKPKTTAKRSKGGK